MHTNKKAQPTLKCIEIYGESHGLHSVVSECFIGGVEELNKL